MFLGDNYPTFRWLHLQDEAFQEVLFLKSNGPLNCLTVEGVTILQDCGNLSPRATASHPRRRESLEHGGDKPISRVVSPLRDRISSYCPQKYSLIVLKII